jgi:hypothetical protein
MVTESFWTTDHVLRHCDGYGVYEGDAWLGFVDTVLLGTDEDVHSLLVGSGDVCLAVPLDAVVAIDPAGERIDLAPRRLARGAPTREELL